MLFNCFAVHFYNVGSIFLMTYLMYFNGLEMLDMQLHNSFVNFSFKNVSAEFTAKFTDDLLM